MQSSTVSSTCSSTGASGTGSVVSRTCRPQPLLHSNGSTLTPGAPQVPLLRMSSIQRWLLKTGDLPAPEVDEGPRRAALSLRAVPSFHIAGASVCTLLLPPHPCSSGATCVYPLLCVRPS